MPASDYIDEPTPEPQPPVTDNTIVTPAIIATVLLAGWIVLYIALAVFGSSK